MTETELRQKVVDTASAWLGTLYRKGGTWKNALAKFKAGGTWK